MHQLGTGLRLQLVGTYPAVYALALEVKREDEMVPSGYHSLIPRHIRKILRCFEQAPVF